MLEDLEVVFISNDSCFVLPNGLHEIILFFIKKTNFNKCVTLSLKCESISQDRVLEIADSLLDLIGLCEDHSKLVEYLTLLVEVWRHFENGNESTDGMIIRLQFFIENSNTIPKLRVFDIF